MKSTHEMLESPEFKTLVRRKWIVSVLLTICLFVTYYGFILLIAVDKAFLARRIGEHTTLGIPHRSGGDRALVGSDGGLRAVGQQLP